MVDDNVVPFPRRLRAVPDPVPNASPENEQAAVVHDGRTYRLEALLRQLTPNEIQIVERSAPRSGQAFWDEVIRRWPALADEIAAASYCERHPR